jgi:hypothetical protein
LQRGLRKAVMMRTTGLSVVRGAAWQRDIAEAFGSRKS